jgi:hypothetical protein
MWGCTNVFAAASDPFGTAARLFNGEWNALVLGAVYPNSTTLNDNIPPSGKIVYGLFSNTLFSLGNYVASAEVNITCYASLYNPCSK